MRESQQDRTARVVRRMLPGSAGGRSEQVGPVVVPSGTLSTYRPPGLPGTLVDYIALGRNSHVDLPNNTAVTITYEIVQIPSAGAALSWTPVHPERLTFVQAGTFFVICQVGLSCVSGMQAIQIVGSLAAGGVLDTITQPPSPAGFSWRGPVIFSGQVTDGDYFFLTVESLGADTISLQMLVSAFLFA